MLDLLLADDSAVSYVLVLSLEHVNKLRFPRLCKLDRLLIDGDAVKSMIDVGDVVA